MTLRKLEAIESLAPAPEVMAKAPMLAIPNFAVWESEVAKQRPTDIDVRAWRRASLQLEMR